MTLTQKIQNLDIIDIGLTKWTMVAFTLCIVSAWSGFTAWVVQTHWAWFFGAFVLLAIRPTVKFLRG